jgi:GAF domain-containing protein
VLNNKSQPVWTESDRLAALRSYRVLDTPPEPAFDDLVQLAAHACQAPIALISLIDERRQWFKAEVGLGVRETSLDRSICLSAMLQPGLTIVPDLTEDPRFARNPLVTGEPHLRFYAGAVLRTPDGMPLGALVCARLCTPSPHRGARFHPHDAGAAGDVSSGTAPRHRRAG